MKTAIVLFLLCGQVFAAGEQRNYPNIGEIELSFPDGAEEYQYIKYAKPSRASNRDTIQTLQSLWVFGLLPGLVGGMLAVHLEQKNNEPAPKIQIGQEKSEDSEKLTAFLASESPMLRQAIERELVTRLTGKGYDLISQSIKPAGEKETFGATLSIHPRAAYVEDTLEKVYYPFILASAVLREKGSGEIIKEWELSYGYNFPNMPTTHVGTAREYRIPVEEDIYQSLSKAQRGLIAGGAMIADHLADELLVKEAPVEEVPVEPQSENASSSFDLADQSPVAS
ncbi:hypothetical protein [Chitinolyticbacter albus]|uniref:hypothetical protein n=1 Tax=Chitinolyticbacter albus TaxID=2961951 RepID=UPI00210D049A|nr:hypothetical protein [Chitinolyticbacter albus]